MTSTLHFDPMPLTQEAFKPFGDVIEAGDDRNHFTINDGHTERFHSLSSVDVRGENGQAAISIFRSTPKALCNDGHSLKIDMMERHPIGSQAFMPLGNEPYLVVVSPKGDFSLESIKVFIANSNQGVSYHAGTWHHYCLALNSVSDFLVVDRVGDLPNCDVEALSPSLTINLTNAVTSRI
jgi:ureidoglycolate lyase